MIQEQGKQGGSRVFLLEIKLHNLTFNNNPRCQGFKNEANIKIGLPNKQALRIESHDIKFEKNDIFATSDCVKTCLFTVMGGQMKDMCKIDIHVYRRDKNGDFPRVGSSCVDLGGVFIQIIDNCKSICDTFILKNVLNETIGSVTASVRITYNGTRGYPNLATDWINLSRLCTLSPAPSRHKMMEINSLNETPSIECLYDQVTRNNSVELIPREGNSDPYFNIQSDLPPYFQTAILDMVGREKKKNK